MINPMHLSVLRGHLIVGSIFSIVSHRPSGFVGCSRQSGIAPEKALAAAAMCRCLNIQLLSLAVAVVAVKENELSKRDARDAQNKRLNRPLVSVGGEGAERPKGR